jgi:ADP-ribose pyrophosphatase YjhB (NUDIX family)
LTDPIQNPSDAPQGRPHGERRGLSAPRAILAAAWLALPKRFRTWVVVAFRRRFVVAAVAVVMDERGRVLLVNHLFRREQVAWGLPGGFVAHPEQPAEAIRRELGEELDLEVESLELVHVRTIKWTRQIEVLFRCRPVGVPRPNSVEVAGAQWFDAETALGMVSLTEQWDIRRAFGLAADPPTQAVLR